MKESEKALQRSFLLNLLRADLSRSEIYETAQKIFKEKCMSKKQMQGWLSKYEKGETKIRQKTSTGPKRKFTTTANIHLVASWISENRHLTVSESLKKFNLFFSSMN